MIFTDTGIIIFRQEFRESDKIASIYTKEHGRVNVRFPSVTKSLGKLKALTELFVVADYRIYVKKGGVMGTVTGGKIKSVFPAIRSSLEKSQLALYCCELMMRFTPPHQPNEQKFLLLLKALTEIDKGQVSSAFVPAFTLRLMEAAGYGLANPVLGIPQAIWQKIHQEDFSSLNFSTPEELLYLSKCNIVCKRFLNQYLTYPLNTTKDFRLNDLINPSSPVVREKTSELMQVGI